MMPLHGAWWGVVALVVGMGPLGAAPVVPASRDVVIAKVRLMGETRPRRVPPATVEEAVTAAREWIVRSRLSSDPRDLGRARSALGRWWTRADVPVEVCVLRAVLRQSLHEFRPALEDLKVAVELEPRHAAAWRTKASVHLVLGEFAEARRSISGCVGAGDVLGATVLAAQLAGVDGDAHGAVRTLEGLLASPAWARAGAEDRAWASGVLGEIRVRQGDMAAAEEALRNGLSAVPADPYLLGALSDLWLAAGRAKEVAALLEGYERMDGLLLRLAEAGRTIHHAEAGRWCRELESRFEKAHARGDRVHLREEARFRLRLCGDPAGAARLAEENWSVQREPPDLALLWEAGQAARDPRLISMAREWVRDRKGEWGVTVEGGR